MKKLLLLSFLVNTCFAMTGGQTAISQPKATGSFYQLSGSAERSTTPPSRPASPALSYSNSSNDESNSDRDSENDNHYAQPRVIESLAVHKLWNSHSPSLSRHSDSYVHHRKRRLHRRKSHYDTRLLLAETRKLCTHSTKVLSDKIDTIIQEFQHNVDTDFVELIGVLKDLKIRLEALEQAEHQRLNVPRAPANVNADVQLNLPRELLFDQSTYQEIRSLLMQLKQQIKPKPVPNRPRSTFSCYVPIICNCLVSCASSAATVGLLWYFLK